MSKSGSIVPIAVIYEQERSEKYVADAMHRDVASGDFGTHTVAIEMVIDSYVETHEFVVISHTIRRRVATKAELRFRDGVRRLFAEKEEGIEQ